MIQTLQNSRIYEKLLTRLTILGQKSLFCGCFICSILCQSFRSSSRTVNRNSTLSSGRPIAAILLFVQPCAAAYVSTRKIHFVTSSPFFHINLHLSSSTTAATSVNSKNSTRYSCIYRLNNNCLLCHNLKIPTPLFTRALTSGSRSPVGCLQVQQQQLLHYNSLQLG